MVSASAVMAASRQVLVRFGAVVAGILHGSRRACREAELAARAAGGGRLDGGAVGAHAGDELRLTFRAAHCGESWALEVGVDLVGEVLEDGVAGQVVAGRSPAR